MLSVPSCSHVLQKNRAECGVLCWTTVQSNLLHSYLTSDMLIVGSTARCPPLHFARLFCLWLLLSWWHSDLETPARRQPLIFFKGQKNPENKQGIDFLIITETHWGYSYRKCIKTGKSNIYWGGRGILLPALVGCTERNSYTIKKHVTIVCMFYKCSGCAEARFVEICIHLSLVYNSVCVKLYTQSVKSTPIKCTNEHGLWLFAYYVIVRVGSY